MAMGEGRPDTSDRFEAEGTGIPRAKEFFRTTKYQNHIQHMGAGLFGQQSVWPTSFSAN